MELISVKLGDLVASGEAIIKTGPFGTQLKAAEYVDYGTPVINVKNIGFGAVVRNKLDMVGQATLERLEAHILRAGDIVFGRKGAVERHAYISEAEAGWMQGSDCIRLRIDSKRVNSHYLSYYFLTPKHQAFMIGMCSHGTTMASLNQKILEQIEIPIPDIKIQNRVVSILNTIDDRISINSKINDNLQQQAYAYFLYLFVENADPTWRLGAISDLGTVVGGGTPSKAKPEYYTENGIAWITPKDLSVDKSKFISHGENDITDIGYRNSSTTMMPKGTVLFSSRAPIGYIAIANNDVTTNQGFKSVVPHKEIGTPYVYYFLNHNLPLIESKASGSTFKEVSGSVMKSVEAVIPDSTTLAKFNDVCNPIFELQAKLEDENRNLATLRDSLLPHLMSGEIDVSDIDI